MSEAIRFYGVRGPYGWLSNFSPHGFVRHERFWPTVEHYFQAHKAADDNLGEHILAAPTPGEAKRRGRSVAIVDHWNTVRDAVMYQGVLAKFDQHPSLKDKLLATGDAVLIEHTRNDRYWGDGGDGTGRNRLGEILMEVRDTLR